MGQPSGHVARAKELYFLTSISYFLTKPISLAASERDENSRLTCHVARAKELYFLTAISYFLIYP